MATRSIIGIQKEHGFCDFIYCHNDGYISNNGFILAEHYLKNVEKVKQLISKGDMSILESEIEKCYFYTQRGEELRIHTCKSSEFSKNASNFDAEYAYLFDANCETVSVYIPSTQIKISIGSLEEMQKICNSNY